MRGPTWQPPWFDEALAVALSLVCVAFFAALGGVGGALAGFGMVGAACAYGLVNTRAERDALRRRVNDLEGLTGAALAIIRESRDPSTRSAIERLWETHFDAMNGHRPRS